MNAQRSIPDAKIDFSILKFRRTGFGARRGGIGDYADVQALVSQVGDAALREVLTHAEAGQFNERSWAYWHYRLGLSSVDHVPALPVRRFA